jgi:predicted Zn-dependent protease
MSPDRARRGRRTCRAAAVLGVVLALAGCASERPLHSWRAQDLARLGEHGRDGDGSAAAAARRLQLLIETYATVAAAAGSLRPELLVAEGDAPNAYALMDEGRPLIAVNLPMLALLGEDRDAMAALVGHELAHLYLRHQAQRRERASEQDSISGLLGFVLSAAGVPFGALLADSLATTAERGNTRDEEREADRLGVDFMRRAGFDPAGAVRLQEKLAAGGEALLPFLATHPSGVERIENMRALNVRSGGE